MFIVYERSYFEMRRNTMITLEKKCDVFLQRALQKHNFSFVANKIIAVYRNNFSSFQIVHLYENTFLTFEEVTQEKNFYFVSGKKVIVKRDEFYFGNKKCVNCLTHREIYTALKKMIYAIKSLEE